MDDRQMLVEVLKDIEDMDHRLDQFRNRPVMVALINEDRQHIDEAARFLVEVKRKVAKYLAGQ